MVAPTPETDEAEEWEQDGGTSLPESAGMFMVTAHRLLLFNPSDRYVCHAARDLSQLSVQTLAFLCLGCSALT